VPPARLLLWFLSIASLGLAVRAFAVAPPPIWVTAGLLALLATWATLGALFPGLRVYADLITRLPLGQRRVALTFDDGPHPETTRAVLRLLEARGAKATFFVVGRKAERYPDVLREIVAAGHALGLHGYRHDRLYSLRSSRYVLADIERSQDAIEAICGVRPRLFRPPIGFVSHLTAIAVERAEVTLAGWSVRALDGLRGATAERVAARVLPRIEDGAIVMLHDAAEREDHLPVSIAVLPRVLDRVAELGLETVLLEPTPPPRTDAARARTRARSRE
jgi:peptidoglycan/xylan/chitin deacetylase (PgdA/CDA1 family)